MSGRTKRTKMLNNKKSNTHIHHHRHPPSCITIPPLPYSSPSPQKKKKKKKIVTATCGWELLCHVLTIALVACWHAAKNSPLMKQ